MTGFLVKICGNLHEEESLAVASFAPDFMGWIFSPLSPRKILPKNAALQIAEIKKKYPAILHCAVFAGNGLEEILGICENFGSFDILQIAENPDFLNSVRNKMNSSRHEIQTNSLGKIKRPVLCPALRVQSAMDDDDLAEYGPSPLYVLDSYVAGKPGGTGKTFNRNLIRAVTKPYLLAGGLNPENVREALLSVFARGADVSSGIEDSPGIKNRQKLKSFIETVRELNK